MDINFEHEASAEFSNVIQFPPRFMRPRPGQPEEDFEPLSSFGLENVCDWLHFFSDPDEVLADILDLASVMNPKDWLCLLGEFWFGFNKIGVLHLPLCAAVAKASGDSQHTIAELMTNWERAAFGQLPDRITIFRGCGEVNKPGCSWTLDRWVAERVPFMNESPAARPMLLSATISKERAAALKLGRTGREIIVFALDENDWTEELLGVPE